LVDGEGWSDKNFPRHRRGWGDEQSVKGSFYGMSVGVHWQVFGQWFYECSRCHTLLKPKPGDSCVYCSNESVPCNDGVGRREMFLT